MLKPEMARPLSRKICGWNATQMAHRTDPPQQEHDKCSRVTLCKADSFSSSICPLQGCWSTLESCNYQSSKRSGYDGLELPKCSAYIVLTTSATGKASQQSRI